MIGGDAGVVQRPERVAGLEFHFGLIGFELSPGEHAIRLGLEPTPVRRAATRISLATLALLVVAIGAARAMRRAPSSPR